MRFHDGVDQQFPPAVTRMEYGSLPSLLLPHAVAWTISCLLPALEDLAALGASSHLRLPPPILLSQQAQPALLLPEI